MIIKSEPNKFIAVDLGYDKQEKETSVQFAHPVIAWSIDEEKGLARPVTPNGVKRSGEYALIERRSAQPKFKKGVGGRPGLTKTSGMKVIVNYFEDTITNAEILIAVEEIMEASNNVTNYCVRVPLVAEQEGAQ